MTATLPPPPGAEVRVSRRIAWLVAGILATFTVLFSTQLPWNTTYLAHWWVPATAALMMPATVALAVGAWRGSRPIMRCASLGLAGGFLAAVGCWYAAWNESPARQVGWLAEMATLPCMATALIWPVEAVVGYSVVAVLASRSILIAADPHGWSADTVNVAGNVALTVVVAVLSRMSIDAAVRLDTGWEDAHTAAARHAGDHARLAERQRLGDLLHDWVLATLLAAARQPAGEDIRRHARIALGKLRSTGTQAPSVRFTAALAANTIRAALTDADPHAEVIVSVTAAAGSVYPSAVVTEMCASLAEVLRNSHRHGGSGIRCTAGVQIDTDGLDAHIADDGCGFDMTTQQLGYGLTRLTERISALEGATATLASSPYGGTTVSLCWRRPPATARAAEDFRALLGIRTPTPPLTSTMLFLLISLVCATATGHGRSITATAAAVGLVTTAAWALEVDRPDPMRRWVAGSVAVIVPTANLIVFGASQAPIAAPSLWPNYLTSAFAPVLCFRGRPTAALAVLILGALPMIVLADRTGYQRGYWLAEAAGGAGAVLLGIFFSFTVRPVMRDTHILRRTSASMHAATAAAATAAQERNRYLAAVLAQASPMLEAISQRPLDDDERRSAAILEARLRSMIRAPGLVDPLTVTAADAARTRGVDVVLIDDSNSERLRADARNRFLRVVAESLLGAQAGTQVTVRLAPDHHRLPATIVSTRAGNTLCRIGIDDNGNIHQTVSRAHGDTRN